MLPRLFLSLIAAALAAAIAFCAWVYLANARLLDQRYPVARVAIVATSGPEAVARGRRLADVTGCTDCHGPDLRGKLFIDAGWLHARIHSSNLTLKAQRYSDEDIARIVRMGVLPDGRGVMVMPSMGYVRLTTLEMADILAFIRSLPAGGVEQPRHWIGPLDHWQIWRGRLKPAAAFVALERDKQPAPPAPEHAAAAHLAQIVCGECHGADLRGNGWGTGAPDLAVAKAYSLEDFRRLLRSGIAAGGRELGLMTRVARDRLHKLGDDDIAAIHAYLACGNPTGQGPADSPHCAAR